MADCKACGEWFGSASDDELCPACQKALKRLKGYAVPVRRGRWIKDGEDGPVYCSECGEEHEWEDYRATYCDTCGAKMDLSEPPKEKKKKNGVTVNQFVCLFPSGTRIKIHMVFADHENTERFNDEDFGVWGSGDYYGITRHPVGECTVREARMLKPFIKNHRYDLDVWAFEPKYCENLKKLREPKEEA